MSETRRVLIVEDSEDAALLLLRELRQGGVEPVSKRVASAESMRASFLKEKWDVVVSDYAMPGFPAFGTLKVIYVSGNTEHSIVEHEVLRAGVNFLQKPFTSDILAGKVREVLEAP